jgi:hypothetical protein
MRRKQWVEPVAALALARCVFKKRTFTAAAFASLFFARFASQDWLGRKVLPFELATHSQDVPAGGGLTRIRHHSHDECVCHDTLPWLISVSLGHEKSEPR